MGIAAVKVQLDVLTVLNVQVCALYRNMYLPLTFFELSVGDC